MLCNDISKDYIVQVDRTDNDDRLVLVRYNRSLFMGTYTLVSESGFGSPALSLALTILSSG